MTTKQMLIQTVKKLPDNASIEDAMERFLFLAKIEKGIGQADAGKTLSHQRVKAKTCGRQG
jgi:predicted transcriptional regulator